MFVRVCIALGLALALGASELEKPLVPARDAAELRTRIQTLMKEQKVPGLSLAFVERDGSLHTLGLGLAEVSSKQAATPETLFRIGSTSKTFVALAALKLVEEGKLDLNTPVRQLVPEVAFQNKWEATDPVRVVHLLEHTTGWDDIHFKEYAHNDPRPVSLAEGLAVGPESRTCRWRPGTRFSYCNSGPAVAAAIVEKLTGQTFENYIQDTFFQPIGMGTATYFKPATAPAAALYRGDGITPFPYWHIALRPAGSINASAQDMGAYLRFFLRRGQTEGRRLISEASLLRMETPTTAWGAQAGLKMGYGLHNYTSQDEKGFVWHGHNGGLDGGLAAMAYMPDQGVGYFFAINAGNGEAFRKIEREVRAFSTRELPAPVLPSAPGISPGIVATYQGWYVPFSPRSQALAFIDPLVLVRLKFQPGGALLKPALGPGQKLVAVDGSRLRHEKESQASIAFLNTSEGRILVFDGPAMRRIGAARAWITIGLAASFLLAFLTVPLFALVWGTRWIFRRMKQVPCLHVRVLPLAAWLCLMSAMLVLGLASEDFLARFGRFTPWSLTLCLGTLGFALFSLASLVAVWRARTKGINRWAYAHSLFVALAFTIAGLYLTWHGFIGFRSWA